MKVSPPDGITYARSRFPMTSIELGGSNSSRIESRAISSPRFARLMRTRPGSALARARSGRRNCRRVSTRSSKGECGLYPVSPTSTHIGFVIATAGRILSLVASGTLWPDATIITKASLPRFSGSFRWNFMFPGWKKSGSESFLKSRAASRLPFIRTCMRSMSYWFEHWTRTSRVTSPDSARIESPGSATISPFKGRRVVSRNGPFVNSR